MKLFANGTKSAKTENKKTKGRKAVIVMAMTFMLSVGGSMQAYAAGASYQILDRVAAGSAYPAIEGLAIEKGEAYVLKYGDNGKCVFFSGEKTNLIKSKNKDGTVKELTLGHGNDMTYRKADKKLYIATMDYSIKRMTLDGDKVETIKTKYAVGSIACWLNSDKFILKEHKDKNAKDKRSTFHLVEINGTKVKEICTFIVTAEEGKKLNQGICMYKGYLYVTNWDSKNGNSYIYRVNEKMSTIEKNKKTVKTYNKTQIAMLDKNQLLKAAVKQGEEPLKGTPLKIEIESIACTTEDYMYFTANANYTDKSGNQKSLDGLYRLNKKLL